MKKAIALILVLLMAVFFASCKKGEEIESQTIETSNTLPTATVGQDIYTTTAPTEAPTITEQTAETMILTTQYGETMPTVVTTKFDPARETTEATVPVSFEIPTMTAPTVYTSEIPTTKATTTTETETEHTEPTEPKNESSDGKTRKALEFTSVSSSPSSKNIVIEFEANGWNGGVKSGKFNASVTTDDGKTGTVVGRVVGIQSSDENFSVVIPIEDIVTEDTISVAITLPAGAVTSRKGDQISKTFTASKTLDW